jgi:hypothetical protein
MTTAYRLRPRGTDLKPGIVLEALKTTEGTTRSPAYVWYPEDGLIGHVPYDARIPYLGGNFNPQRGGAVVLSLHQLTVIWKVINSTDISAITSDNLAASMGSKNSVVDVFELGFVVSLSLPKDDVDGGVSFLVCTAEFVHVRHTDKGN